MWNGASRLCLSGWFELAVSRTESKHSALTGFSGAGPGLAAAAASPGSCLLERQILSLPPASLIQVDPSDP